MKNIRELTNFELYLHIFKPIFKYNIDDKYPVWNLEDIINLKFEPRIYIPEYHKKEYEELENRKKKGEHYVDFNDIVEVLHKKNIAKDFSIPIFEINEDDKKIIISLSHILNKRRDGKLVETFKEYSTYTNHITFYKNGDIAKSFYTSSESGMFVNYTKHTKFLSYTETLEMRKYFENLNIDIINLVPNEFVI